MTRGSIGQALPGKRQFLWVAIAAALGIGLSYLDSPILPDVTLIYTGICYLAISLAYGPAAGGVCSVLSMARTVFLFGDGYSMLIAALESVTIGSLTRKRYSALAASLIFWGLVGLPLLWLVVFHILKNPSGTGWAIVVKRIVNGLVNVTIADFLLMAPGVLRALGVPPAGHRSRGLRQIMSAAFLVAALLPILFLSIVHGRSFAHREERQAVTRLRDAGLTVRREIDEYLQKHVEAIVSLERSIERSGRFDPPALRENLRQHNEVYRGFLTMLAADSRGKVLATHASGGELKAAGGDFIDDREYFKQPMRSGKPYISDVFAGRGLGRDPIVAVSAAVRGKGGEPLGLVEGSLNLARFQRFEDSFQYLEDADFLVLDQHDRVIYASPQLHYAMLTRIPGRILLAMRRTDNDSVLLPSEKSGEPAGPRTIVSYAKSDLTGWQIVVQQSTRPMQRQIEDYYLHALGWLIVAASAVFLFSDRVARRVTAPLETLVGALRGFDVSAPPEAPLVLPPSAPRELIGIQTHFNELSRRLSESHAGMVQALAGKEELNRELQDVLEDLDRKVQVRTVELAGARARAETASKAKSLFLANMSHEIRTPLNAVLGYSQLMMRDSGLGSESQRCLNIINSSGEHLLALLNDILDMSKIEAGRVKLNPVAFDLPRLIADLADMFRQRASSKGLAFEAAAAEDLAPCVVADQGKTRQVLINLLGNAVKFTERGGVQLRVSTSVRPDGRSWLAAEVEDSGPGIADREMAQLFQPFGQAAGNSQIEGTGLGLAISREYARLMGGDLTARSQAGEGTVFRFEMPVTAGSESEAGPNLSRVSVKRVEPGNDSRVLVVDDDLNNREWISNLLSSVGFFIRGAADGEEALRAVAEWRPHFIFMDLRMPVMNGVEAMRAIRAGAGPQPAIIAWSASALDEDRRAAMDAGADAFISKPCRAQELLEEIARRLGIRYEYNEPIREPEAGFADIPAARASRLRALPAAWIQELHQATRKGEKARMNLAIGKIEQRDQALAEALRDLADRYEYDALSALCATTDQ